MQAAKVHFEKIVRRPDFTKVGTLCNRMSAAGEDINSTGNRDEVTCKFCLRLLRPIACTAA